VKRHFPLVLLILISCIVGLLMLPGYGESTDERSQWSYGERTVRAFESLLRTGRPIVEETPAQGGHGPAFILMVTLLKDLFLPAGTAVQRLYFSHFLYFLMFLVGVVSLYFLTRRWMSEIAAFGAALLFCTQPVLVGHAFINPKDVIFMSLLIASAVLGLRLVDRSETSLQASAKPLSEGMRSFFRQFLRLDIWLAAFVLGFSSAIRIAAPLIGLVVLGYILVSRKWHALPAFVAYGLIALCFMLLFWPYLWPDPVGRFLESTLTNTYYPDSHSTLFRGALMDSQQTSRFYLPVLLAIQLTETTLFLLLLGTVALLRKVRWELVVVITIWFILPFLLVLWTRTTLYGNFRQVFFILPSLFLLAGLGLDWLLSLFRRPVIQYSLIFLMILPGLYANIRLYPYQYVYYNQLTGGLRGAYRVYELDYWHLAYREAQEYLNENAGLNANIYAGGTKQNAQTFARPDLIFNALGGRRLCCEGYDYVIVSTAENADERYDGLPTVFLVEREGVPLVYVKKPR
jgi:hypothetical protein